MPPIRLAARICLSLAVLVCAPVLAWAGNFAQETSDLPVDPAVKWGRLDNGLRYALLHNQEPKGRVSVRLAVRVGSVYENDKQLGIAHFLEHMAFNGSTHFPAASVVEFFQRMGMNFGGDTNASTNFDRTIYQLELPDTKPETLRESLTFISDVAGGLLFDPAKIEKERGIILSEKRDRDSVGLRTFVAELQFLIPDSLFPQRLPIGSEEIIHHAQRDLFVEFYNSWYRPERMFVVIVGDIDPAAVEPLVKELFSSIKDRGPELAEPNLGTVTPPPTVVAELHAEPEAGSTTVALETVVPYAHEDDNIANRLKYLPRNLAVEMLNRRISILAKKEGVPFVSGSLGISEQFEFFRNASIELNCRPDQWQAALGVAEQQLRSALEYGFQSDELNEAVAEMRNNLEQSARTAATRHSGGLADDIVDDLLDRNVTTHPSADLSLYEPALSAVTTDACTAALRAAWAEAKGRKIFVTGNLQLADSGPKITDAYTASHAMPVAAQAKTEQGAFAYTNFGPAGKVANRKNVDDLGASLLQFENGVRLNIKQTDFEAGRIRVSVRVGAGTLTEPLDERGLALLANVAFTAGGLGQHSVDDLQRLLAGKTIGLGFGAQSDTFSFSGTTNRTDLLLQLQLFCAFMTDPGYRPEAIRQVHKVAEQVYQRLAHTAEGPMQLEVEGLLARNDPRFGLPPEKVMQSRTLEELKAWLSPEFAHGPIEIAIVGDLDPEATIAAVGQTFGALPMRSAKPAYTEARKVLPPAQPLAKSYTVESEIPKTLVRLYWPATDAFDVKLARRIRLLTDVFSDRLRVKIREELGGTYSPNAGAELSDTYPGYGFLVADVTVAPEQARTLADAVKAVAGALHDGGVTDEELVRAKQPVLTALRESARTNPYWLGSVLSSAQEFPNHLDWSRTRYSDNESVTAAELSALAKQYLDPAKVSEFIIAPTPTPAKPSTAPTTSTPTAK